jgi:endonuclease-3
MPKETIKAKKERMATIIDIMEKTYPKAGIQLESDNVFQLMVAVVLSAQCTDKRVNIVTKELFALYPTIENYIDMPNEELERLIYSTGFYKAKAKNIINGARYLMEAHNGEMPGTMEELLKIPGVGRKSANVILGHYFDVPGIVVDTHVKRISNRLGFVNTDNPTKIEFELQKYIAVDKWVMFTHYVIELGRAICKGQRPKCEKCPLADHCKSAHTFVK